MVIKYELLLCEKKHKLQVSEHKEDSISKVKHYSRTSGDYFPSNGESRLDCKLIIIQYSDLSLCCTDSDYFTFSKYNLKVPYHHHVRNS